ncbi:MAG TPA: hypothetical protein PK103_02000, partial [Elusimicrobiales bacterium]|nr:hypothetical protein [Elusimicrobiales bacterium]
MKKIILALLVTLSFASVGFVNNLSAQSPGEEMSQAEEGEDMPDIGPYGMGMGPGNPMGGPGMGMKRNIKKPGIGMQRMGQGQREFFDDGMESKVLEIIKTNDPEFHKKIIALKGADTVKYRQIIKMSFNFLTFARNLEDKTIEKDIVKGISLEYDVRELGLKYEKASDSDKTKIKEEIKSKLNALFDIRTKVQELRVKRLE